MFENSYESGKIEDNLSYIYDRLDEEDLLKLKKKEKSLRKKRNAGKDNFES